MTTAAHGSPCPLPRTWLAALATQEITPATTNPALTALRSHRTPVRRHNLMVVARCILWPRIASATAVRPGRAGASCWPCSLSAACGAPRWPAAPSPPAIRGDVDGVRPADLRRSAFIRGGAVTWLL